MPAPYAGEVGLPAPAARYPYLHDMAGLERALHRAHYAADSRTLSLVDLAGKDADEDPEFDPAAASPRWMEAGILGRQAWRVRGYLRATRTDLESKFLTSNLLS